jgi:hopene-associated glycosyltransferase HpnB
VRRDLVRECRGPGSVPKNSNPIDLRALKPCGFLKVESDFMLFAAIAAISAALWVYLIFGRGRFWTTEERDNCCPPRHTSLPLVVAVVPARNEADVISASVESLLAQDYPGEFSIFVVDDNSTDATAARCNSVQHQARRKLRVIASSGLPRGWTGKLWAIKQGIAAAEARENRPQYVWLTDADIVHAPDTLTWLVAQATHNRYALTSLMAKLRVHALAERTLIPAFVYFFRMLFPFSWVNQKDCAIAAAAGGCMLIRLDALHACGGVESVRNALIDDCALAERLKTYGPIWLGLTERVRSIRPYARFSDIGRMISRTAYTQLRYSPSLLAITVTAMALVFILPPAFAIFGDEVTRWLGLVAWLAMAITFQPTLRFYRMSPLWGFALPAVAAFYCFHTIKSAHDHARRRGGAWKGRVYANPVNVR